ncbi:hypothetical protein BJV82DRAFT_710764 [Fennellomyces sp. T-0311]|nr:hypothetical protein BJV82DRAFT_710764 [Fennellomyces sp. T-0311]
MTEDYQGRFISPISEITGSAHLVPDFTCPTYSAISILPYDSYLVNYDVSQHHWWEGGDNGVLMTMEDSDLVKWGSNSDDEVAVVADEEASSIEVVEEEGAACVATESLEGDGDCVIWLNLSAILGI